MITLRRAQDRGHFDHGWLRTWHTFSFADYRDPAHDQFRTLRVLNEDIVAPGTGFGMHPHRDMEILTWILSGGLRHQDSMGHEAVIRPGEVQVMSAGTGIVHSEHNVSDTEPVHLLQVWILPERRGLPTRYAQAPVELGGNGGPFTLLAAPPGEPAPVAIHQDVRVYAASLEPGQEAKLDLLPGRHAFLQVARGDLTLQGEGLGQGDGAAVSAEGVLQLACGSAAAEALIFDLA